jgi:hypothetical protein
MIIVMNRSNPQPTLSPVGVELFTEPGELTFADPSIVVFFAMAFQQRRVESRDNDFELLDDEEAPGDLLGELNARMVLVEVMKHSEVGIPLGRVGSRGLLLQPFALGEVALAERTVDVVVSRDDAHPCG